MTASTESTEYTEYVDDPDGKLALEMATDPSVGFIIHVKNDGTVMVHNRTGKPLQNIASPGPLPPLPGGAQLKAAYVVFTRNPTCVWCLHAGQWKEVCWP